jgi:hypothetical protein
MHVLGAFWVWPISVETSKVFVFKNCCTWRNLLSSHYELTNQLTEEEHADSIFSVERQAKEEISVKQDIS